MLLIMSTGKQDFQISAVHLYIFFFKYSITSNYLITYTDGLAMMFCISKKSIKEREKKKKPKHVYKLHLQSLDAPVIHKYTKIIFPHFFHLFITINSIFSITFSCVMYSSVPFKTSPVCDYSLEPEES